MHDVVRDNQGKYISLVWRITFSYLNHSLSDHIISQNVTSSQGQ